MSKTFKNTIKSHLDERAKADPKFAESYAKEDKSIDECCRYILSQMSKRGNAVATTNEEVYGMAIHYYDEDDLKVPKSVGGAAAHTSAPKVELTEEEKAKAREEALELFRKNEIERIRDAEKKKIADAKAKKREAKGNIESETPSLFDL